MRRNISIAAKYCLAYTPAPSLPFMPILARWEHLCVEKNTERSVSKLGVVAVFEGGKHTVHRITFSK